MKIQLPINHRSEWIAITTVMRISGSFSFLGSSLILLMIFIDRINKLKQTHYRLLAGVCCFDILVSLSMIVSTAAIPKDTEAIYNIYGNIGNNATCKAQGFFLQLGLLGMPLYIVSLSLYYLLVIRYNVNDDLIRRKVEPCMHIFSISIPFIMAVAALCLNLYHQKLIVCWIEAEPWGCTVDDSLVCTEAANAPWYEVFFAGVWCGLAFVFEVICMGLIYATVRKREQVMNSFSFRGRDGRVLAPCSTRVSQERRDTAIQAILYISAFFFTYLWPIGSFIMIHVCGRSPNFKYALVSVFFGSLLGFWNFIAFLRPRYMKTSRAHVDKSFLWKLKIILLSKVSRSTQLSRNVARRRSSAGSIISTISSKSSVMFLFNHTRFKRRSSEEHAPVPQDSLDSVVEEHEISDMDNHNTPSKE